MRKTMKYVGIAALVAVIGFVMIACDDGSGDDPGNPFNGTWKTADGNEYKLNNGNFEYSENSKTVAKGTYTAERNRAAITGTIAMAIKQLHGDALNEVLEDEGIEPLFESDWYTKDKVKDAFGDWAEENGWDKNDFLEEKADLFDDMFPTLEGEVTIDGNNCTMTIDGETFTKEVTTSGGGGAAGLVAKWYTSPELINMPNIPGFPTSSIPYFEFTSNGKMICHYGENDEGEYNYTVSGNTISIDFGRTTANFSVRGKTLTISNAQNPDGAWGMTVFDLYGLEEGNGTYYKK